MRNQLQSLILCGSNNSDPISKDRTVCQDTPSPLQTRQYKNNVQENIHIQWTGLLCIIAAKRQEYNIILNSINNFIALDNHSDKKRYSHFKINLFFYICHCIEPKTFLNLTITNLASPLFVQSLLVLTVKVQLMTHMTIYRAVAVETPMIHWKGERRKGWGHAGLFVEVKLGEDEGTGGVDGADRARAHPLCRTAVQ